MADKKFVKSLIESIVFARIFQCKNIKNKDILEMKESNVAKRAADTIRVLSAEAIQKANSGHPGMPMGGADYAFVLWQKYNNLSNSIYENLDGSNTSCNM